jgi:enamine deaminase RidA (YjgF/YER057c/UK114 family)
MPTALSAGRLRTMSAEITRINPVGLHSTPGYHHITVVEAGRTAYLAGQCPLDHDGALVGEDDLDAQIDQVVANALVALEAVGAGPGDVVRSVIYVVTPETAGCRPARLRGPAGRGRPDRGASERLVTSGSFSHSGLIGGVRICIPGRRRCTVK